jgi:cellulose synthase operon protein C
MKHMSFLSNTSKPTAKNKIKIFAAILMASVALSACTPPAEKAKAYLASGQKYLEQKDYVKAALEFRNALKISQDNADAWFGMAQIEEQSQNWNLVQGDLSKAIEINPKHVKARMALSRLNMLAGNFDAALKQVDSALENNPNDATNLASRAAILLKMKKPADAIAEAKKALAVEKNNVDALMVLAAERLNNSDFPGSKVFVDQALKATPDSLGMLLFAINLYEKSADVVNLEKALRHLTEIDPKQAGYRKALVTFLMQQKRPADAEKELRSMASANPDDLETNLDLVRFLVSTSANGADVAVAELKKLIDTGHNQSGYKSALAQLYFELNKKDEAIALLKEVIAKEGISDAGIAARLDLSGKFILLRNLDDADKLVAEALGNDARNVEGLRQKAAIAIERGNLDDATNSLREALNEAPNNPMLYQMLAAVFERSGSIELADKNMSDAFRISKYDVKAGLDYVRFLVRRGRTEHAENVLTNLLEFAPNNIEVKTMMADMKLRRQDWKGAQDLAQSIQQSPGNVALSSQITAAALAGQNKLDDSIQVLLNANREAPDAKQTQFSLLKAYLSVQRYPEAEDLLKKLLTAEPKNAEAQVYLGVVQMNTKRPDEAKASFLAAIASEPQNPVGYRALSEMQVNAGDMEAALETLKSGLEKSPKQTDLRFALAGLYERKGDIDAAITSYEELLADDPSSMLAANNYASLVSDHRTDAASIEKAAKAAAVLRSSPISQFKDTLGWILLLKGENKEALEILKQSTADLPDLMLTHYHLGKAFAAAGDVDSATQSYNKAQSLAKTDEEKLLISTALQQLKTVVPAKKT